jgi:hypothetical protein
LGVPWLTHYRFLPHHRHPKTLNLTVLQPRPDLLPYPKTGHFCQTDAAYPGTAPLSLAMSASFYTTFASNPTANLIEGAVPFFRFPFPHSGPWCVERLRMLFPQ